MCTYNKNLVVQLVSWSSSFFGSDDFCVLGFEVVGQIHDFGLKRNEVVHVEVGEDLVWVV